MSYMVKRNSIAECIVGDGALVMRTIPGRDIPAGARGKVTKVESGAAFFLECVHIEFSGEEKVIAQEELQYIGFETAHLPGESAEPADEKEPCEECGGTGMVPTDEDDGEGHTMRGVGTKLCVCQKTNDYDHE